MPVEVITVTAVTSTLSLYATIKNLERLPVGPTFYIAFTASLVAILGFIILHKTIKRALGKLFMQDLNLKALPVAFMLQTISWSLYSAGTIVLVGNLGEIKNFPLFFSSTLLAWLVGYLSLITPMGLGVREGAFVLLTGGQIGVPQAVVIAVLSRIILIITELTNLAFWAYLLKRKSV